ncbi:MAG: PTS sugar transporter subunit IIA [Deltaproteobacteria bacterium]|jgi:PTS system galactitol-specific IIA component|nr:PTS sugar transporter subunit IIA [Deltaproteobacteria bacterium]
MIWEELDIDLILTDVKAESSDDVMETIGQKLVDKGYCKETFVGALKKRESEFPTGIDIDGFGIAMPHTDVTHVVKSGMALGVLKTPVVFTQMGTEDSPVEARIVVMLAIENAKAHLAKMQQILTIFQDKSVLARIGQSATGEEVVKIIRDKEQT